MNDTDGFGMKGAGSKMPHSHSTPAGVDGGSRTPPTTPRKAGKMLAVRVQMLDDSITMFQVQVKYAFICVYICLVTARAVHIPIERVYLLRQ